MTLSVDKRYDIIFLSHHPMGAQRGMKTVAKAIKCAKSTVQCWLSRWKESKDLSDLKRVGRPRSTMKKMDQRISDLATTNNSATTRGMQRVLKRKNVDINQETIRRRLKKYGAKFSLPISKPLITEKTSTKTS